MDLIGPRVACSKVFPNESRSFDMEDRTCTFGALKIVSYLIHVWCIMIHHEKLGMAFSPTLPHSP